MQNTSPKCILFIEDEKEFREIFSKLMQYANRLWRNEPEGLPRFTPASSPSEADNILSTAGYEEFDAILLDLTFAQGHSPMQTLEWLRERRHVLPPVVILTGGLTDGIEEKCFEAGAVDFIYKGSDINNLAIEILKKVVYAVWRNRYAKPVGA